MASESKTIAAVRGGDVLKFVDQGGFPDAPGTVDENHAAGTAGTGLDGRPVRIKYRAAACPHGGGFAEAGTERVARVSQDLS